MLPEYKEEAPRRRTLRCLYSCAPCGTRNAGVDVPERADGQDVSDWVERVAMMAIAADHAARNPKCASHVLSHVFIPAPEEAKGVGFLPTSN